MIFVKVFEVTICLCFTIYTFVVVRTGNKTRIRKNVHTHYRRLTEITNIHTNNNVNYNASRIASCDVFSCGSHALRIKLHTSESKKYSWQARTTFESQECLLGYVCYHSEVKFSWTHFVPAVYCRPTTLHWSWFVTSNVRWDNWFLKRWLLFENRWESAVRLFSNVCKTGLKSWFSTFYYGRKREVVACGPNYIHNR